jgi:hypothetical protein
MNHYLPNFATRHTGPLACFLPVAHSPPPLPVRRHYRRSQLRENGSSSCAATDPIAGRPLRDEFNRALGCCTAAGDAAADTGEPPPTAVVVVTVALGAAARADAVRLGLGAAAAAVSAVSAARAGVESTRPLRCFNCCSVAARRNFSSCRCASSFSRRSSVSLITTVSTCAPPLVYNHHTHTHTHKCVRRISKRRPLSRPRHAPWTSPPSPGSRWRPRTARRGSC